MTPTPNSSWKDAFFLSTDNQFDPESDVRIGTESTFVGIGLDPGSSYEKMSIATAPVNLAAGEYFLIEQNTMPGLNCATVS